MSKFIKTEKEVTNKKDRVIERVLNWEPKQQGKLSIHEVNNIYKRLVQSGQVDPKKIMIKVVAFDGYKTIKSYDHDGDDLEMVYDDYYSSLPRDTKDKFENLLAFQIITKPY
jgi:hypothetical protein